MTIKRLLSGVADRFGYVLVTKEGYEGLVMTKAREWPNAAANARDDAADDAAMIAKISSTALNSKQTPEENIRGWGLVNGLAQHILRLLESVGGRTRP